MPKVDPSIAPDRFGFYNELPGYGNALGRIEGSKARGTEAAKAEHDLVKIVGDDGAERFVPRSQALQAARPQPRPAQPAGQPVGAFIGDPKMVAQGIEDIKDPTERARARQAYEQQYGAIPGPFQATPTTAQRSEAKAAETTAEINARDMAETRKNILNAGMTAPTTIAKYQQLGKLLADVDGGALTATGTNIASAANSLGLKIDKNLPNKEAAAALGNEMALQLRSPAGGAGMPGAMSDKDREFLVGMIPNASQTAQGRKQLIDAQVAIEKRKQQVSTFMRNYEKKYGKLDNGFFEQMQAWSNANPLFGGN
jgi:hypothetical protein